ncbi:MAG: leucine-rich repeat domain-containing protein [Chitinophagaceae bacterium]|nr:leucine-rich repeat domain-containing protein [Chitinophagaceae bacterium]
MKKPALLVTLFLASLLSYSQKDKVYTSLEEALKNPSDVFILALNNKKLTDIPESILRFTNLTTLDLAGNKLSSVPENITS